MIHHDRDRDVKQTACLTDPGEHRWLQIAYRSVITEKTGRESAGQLCKLCIPCHGFWVELPTKTGTSEGGQPTADQIVNLPYRKGEAPAEPHAREPGFQ